jgi:uncharacterized protein (DUF433 family)
MSVALNKTAHPYISIDPLVASGQPTIAGSRTKVMDIALRYEYMGLSADEIIEQFPHLTLPQVHDALSYYYENKQELDSKYEDEQEFVKQLKKQFSAKLKARLR